MKSFDYKAPTTQLLGRFQPWHDGHFALFLRAYEKTGQVCIMVRDTSGDLNNPFDFVWVKNRIVEELGKKGFHNYVHFVVVLMPNITNITYGRDVGYKIEQEIFDDATHAISATKIRKEMGL